MGLNLALAAQATTSAVGGLLSFLPTILMFVVLIYFMVIRPQKKRQQSAKTLLESLGVGDKIQTIGGFIGEVTEMDGDEFVILSEGSKLRVKKNAVAIRLSSVEPIESLKAPKVEKSKPVLEKSKPKGEEEKEDFKIEDFEI